MARPKKTPPLSAAEALTQSRQPIHGAFSSVASYNEAATINMAAAPNWSRISDVRKMALREIQHKIARILCGNPEHADHWDDIGGYAELGKKNESALPVLQFVQRATLKRKAKKPAAKKKPAKKSAVRPAKKRAAKKRAASRPQPLTRPTIVQQAAE